MLRQATGQWGETDDNTVPAVFLSCFFSFLPNCNLGCSDLSKVQSIYYQETGPRLNIRNDVFS